MESKEKHQASAPLESGNMIWVLQQDFLEGAPVQDAVRDLLQPVANPLHDSDIE